MVEKFEIIDDLKIRYKSRGSGPFTLLLLHGAVGSIDDFSIQLDGEYGLSREEFTVVALDLPGFGQSELPEELKTEPTLEYFEFASLICAKLMQRLKFKTYAICGWNDGARIASLMAIRFQSRIDALILWGFIPVMDKESSLAISRTRDTSIWNPTVLKFYTTVYGEQNFSDMWHKYVDYVVASYELPEHFDIRDRLSAIKCPTLILHGSKDPLVNFVDHVKPLEMKIYDSSTMQIPNLAHNIHQANPDKFNKVLSTFAESVRVV